MFKKKHLSGAEKRKRKDQKNQSTAKLMKITGFLNKSISSIEEISTKTDKEENDGDVLSKITDPDKEKFQCEVKKITPEAENAIEINETSFQNEPSNSYNFVKTDAIITSLSNFIPPSSNHSADVKLKFWQNHPIQPFVDVGKLNLNRIYFKKLSNGDVISRKWISFSVDTKCFYCATCMAFSVGSESKFVSGYNALAKSNHNPYQDIDRHENSAIHQNATNAVLRCHMKTDIGTLINRDLLMKRAKEVKQRRMVLSRLIDIILFIGKQNIAYRGKYEGAHSLDNPNQNHGNFLELVLLVANYDSILNSHVIKSINDSKKYINKKGRGSLNTFLSKHFINDNIINRIGISIQMIIVEQIKECKHFSIMIDSTQDTGVLDQLAICIRYLYGGKVEERLISLVVCSDSSGLALFNLLCNELKTLNLSLTDVIACAFDGAANMKGAYNGLQAHMKNTNPSIVYTHCLSHVLNLTMEDSTKQILEAENLFGLVEQTAVFLSDSYKRMEVWKSITGKNHSAHKKLYRLQKICITRWWSKNNALSSIIDIELPTTTDSLKESKLITLFQFLLEINKGNFNSSTKFMARTLIEKWSNFRTVFMSLVLLNIYSITTPVSIYLQTKSLDYLKAWSMISTMLKKIKNFRNDEHITYLYKKSQEYTKKINIFFLNEPFINIEEDFTEKRISKKKILSGHLATDESRNMTQFDKFKIMIFSILDNVENSISQRFIPNENLLKDCGWLDPKKYCDILTYEQFPDDVFIEITKLANVERIAALTELKQFVIYYDSFIPECKKGKTNKNEATTLKETELESDLEINYESIQCQKCNKCLACAFVLIEELSKQSGLFNNLYIVFKCAMILPSTQVSCERVFSKLKIIKNRLRSTLSQNILTPFMLMSIEKDIAESVNKENIINDISNSSTELKRLLQ